ncbi:antifreeze protein, type I [Paractinoplanes deccanensis]|uniref:Antifreeze protein, type I n=1 Tax=Paractinoplanes deccanensis TaxID=113561 RepID=A0ABQ3XWS8_9ACTN|nr:glycosyl transferase [Actinoplanes deccanensis]GID72112.1 antifreeze protein, type I [Actinoplanes deccanensis]
MPVTVYDVAVLADFRQPGAASAALAAEVHAQAEAALSTVLVHVPAPQQPAGPLGFRHRISDLLRAGAATLARDDQPVAARLLVVRRPWTRPAALSVRAERTVLVADRPPAEPAVYEQARHCFGAEAAWAPAGPRAREQLLRVAPDARIDPDDWHEIIDVAHWWRDRDGFVGDEPVVGLRGPFPVDLGDLRVRWLGDTSPFPQWEAVPFGAELPDEFLRTVDFLVDFQQTFSRSALEAMAAGVPVIVGEHLRPFLAGAALHSPPDGVPALVREVYADPERYRAVVDRAREFAERHYGHRSHLVRLARYGIRPRINVPGPRRELVPAAPAGPRRILMAAEDDLSLLLAVARRLPAGLAAVVVTQSSEAPIAHREGFLTEYIPSREALGVPEPRWTRLLRDRLAHLVDLYAPEVVVVDGLPYEGIVRAVRDHPGVTWVWMRRAMWPRGAGAEWMAAGRAFEHVLEPGEFAALADDGPTVAERSRVHRVGPITGLDAGELLDAARARAELRLDDRPAALLRLAPEHPEAIERIAAHLRRHGFQLVLAESPVAATPMPSVAGARIVQPHPIGRFLRAFELTVSTAGYQAYHEHLASGVATVFVPDRRAALDDQVGRARYADAAGVALTVEDPASAELDQVLDAAVRPEVRAALRRRCAELTFGNGAAAAAAWLSGLTARVRG